MPPVTTKREPYIRTWLKWAPRLALAAAAICLAILVSYAFGWEPGWRPVPEGPGTHPWTALGLLAVAIATLLDRPLHDSRIGTLLVVAVAILATVNLGFMVAGIPSPLQTWAPFAPTLAAAAAAGHPILMVPNTAAMLLLLSGALILRRLHWSQLAQFCALLALFCPFLSLLSYDYGIPTFWGTMPLPVTIAGFLCIVAILGRKAHRAPLRNILVAGPRGHFARWLTSLLIAPTLIVAFLIGFNASESPGTFAVRAAAILVIVVLVVAYATFPLQRIERRQRQPKLTPDEADLADTLRGAWTRGEMALVFQPQVNLATRDMIGVEALLRWHHPKRGEIHPDAFISIAERSGLIVPLGVWVLREACERAKSWNHPALRDTKISVNVSALQLSESGFVRAVADILRGTALPAGRLVLEVTESAMMEQGDMALASLRGVRALGAKVAIDDFGTGYSSLSYLRVLPSDYIKIDQSFVRGLPNDANAAAIARSVIALGHTLGLTTLAEGIETSEQADFLEASWCDEGQGFLYSRPLAERDLLAWADSRPAATPRHLQ